MVSLGEDYRYFGLKVITFTKLPKVCPVSGGFSGVLTTLGV